MTYSHFSDGDPHNFSVAGRSQKLQMLSMAHSSLTRRVFGKDVRPDFFFTNRGFSKVSTATGWTFASSSSSSGIADRGPNRRTATTPATPKKETKYKPPPQHIPTAHASHTPQAVVKPLICPESLKIKAPPKNPTPEGKAAATREESQVWVPASKA